MIKKMRKIVATIIIAIVSTAVSAQYRLEAGLKVGPNKVYRDNPNRSIEWGLVDFETKASYGIEVNSGYSFKIGVGVMSGIGLDILNTAYHDKPIGYMGNQINKDCDTYRAKIKELTIPIKIDYTYELKQIKDTKIRPFAGVGCGINIGNGGFLSKYDQGSLRIKNRNHRVAIFGADVIWRHIIIGFAWRKDKTSNIQSEWEGTNWKPIDYCFRQSTVKIGWRIR